MSLFSSCLLVYVEGKGLEPYSLMIWTVSFTVRSIAFVKASLQYNSPICMPSNTKVYCIELHPFNTNSNVLKDASLQYKHLMY